MLYLHTTELTNLIRLHTLVHILPGELIIIVEIWMYITVFTKAHCWVHAFRQQNSEANNRCNLVNKNKQEAMEL